MHGLVLCWTRGIRERVSGLELRGGARRKNRRRRDATLALRRFGSCAPILLRDPTRRRGSGRSSRRSSTSAWAVTSRSAVVSAIPQRIPAGGFRFTSSVISTSERASCGRSRRQARVALVRGYTLRYVMLRGLGIRRWRRSI